MPCSALYTNLSFLYQLSIFKMSLYERDFTNGEGAMVKGDVGDRKGRVGKQREMGGGGELSREI